MHVVFALVASLKQSTTTTSHYSIPSKIKTHRNRHCTFRKCEQTWFCRMWQLKIDNLQGAKVIGDLTGICPHWWNINHNIKSISPFTTCTLHHTQNTKHLQPDKDHTTLTMLTALIHSHIIKVRAQRVNGSKITWEVLEDNHIFKSLMSITNQRFGHSTWQAQLLKGMNRWAQHFFFPLWPCFWL